MQIRLTAAVWAIAILIFAIAGCPQKQDQSDAKALAPGQVANNESGSRADHAEAATMPDMDLGWVGDAVDFSCTTFDGGQFRASDSGKPVVINFWAAW